MAMIPAVAAAAPVAVISSAVFTAAITMGASSGGTWQRGDKNQRKGYEDQQNQTGELFHPTLLARFDPMTIGFC